MLVVELTVASEDFIDTVNSIGEWLAAEQVETPFSTFAGDRVRRQIRMGFARDEEAERFAARFGGNLLDPGMPAGQPRRSVNAEPDAAPPTIWK